MLCNQKLLNNKKLKIQFQSKNKFKKVKFKKKSVLNNMLFVSNVKEAK